MKSFGQAFFCLFLALCLPANATRLDANFVDEGLASAPNGGQYDKRVDYDNFMGRVSDKSDDGRILKIKVENNNTKFLKPGDQLFFQVNNHKTRRSCRGFVRSSEDYHFTLHVQDFSGCWRDKYFKIGFQLNFKAPIAGKRIFEASEFRKLLIERKESFLGQLNGINHWLWSYDQQRIKVAADYDERINELKKEKQIAVDNFVDVKKERLLLQKELTRRLDELDISLDHYKVERHENLTDRWNLDHDTRTKFPQRPLKLKKLKYTQDEFSQYR